MTYTRERDTPSTFDMSYDGDMPQRHLNDFVVTRDDEKISICALDEDASRLPPIVARGVLTNGKTTIKIVTRPLVEWCIDYSSRDPHLWVRSERVWYRLFKPAKEYIRTHDLARRRFELCVRIFILATTVDESERNFRSFAAYLSAPYYDMRPYTEKDILAERTFILAQLRELDNPELRDMPFVRELRDRKAPASKKTPSTRAKRDREPTASPKSESPSETPSARRPPTPPPRSNTSWTPSPKLDDDSQARLLKRMEKIINQIYKSKLAYPFRAPVEPLRDGCADYLTRIRIPMDYGTIKKRLESSSYSSVKDVVADFYQVGANCREYNGDLHEFSQWANELQRKFDALLRTAEDTEITAMAKRAGSSKKRRASSELPPSGKGVGKKSATKSARKIAIPKSAPAQDLSPVASSSSVKDDDASPTKLCARSESNACNKAQTPGSKYCSEECGLIVARKRLAELNVAGFSPDEYVRAFITKALVHSRS